ncbi:hypothetical protein KPH14_012693 [Odynerus spinipes]|uniref:CCHC-type domain-containing protein n=1 Tax=Odynerus spinipes TaxID=1348599 RepID=A0AAD9RE70_9HYME|nr:hypothetical protein KPH14_012693 [Odynerus spinipes]
MPKPNYRERGELSSGDAPERLHAKHWAHFPKHIDPTASILRPSKPCRVCQKYKKRRETMWEYAACREHDIAYANNKDLSQRHAADKILVKLAKERVTAKDARWGERHAAAETWGAMNVKRKLGMGIQRTSTMKKKNPIKRRKLQIAKRGGFIPLISLLGMLGSLAGCTAGVVSAIKKAQNEAAQLEELRRHNRAMEGKGLYLEPYSRRGGALVPLKSKIYCTLLIMNTPSQKPSPAMSYARIAQQTLFPTREQAIVLDSAEGITIQEYTIAIGKLIDPKNVRFASRISHGRVCLYLNSKESVDKLIESHTKVYIGQHVLEIRPLISKAKRIILSNVCPIIPHQTIQDELFKHKIRLCSQITFIRASINDPNYSHVLSFRRQVYIHPEVVYNLPNVLEINYDDLNFFIYPTTEKLTCFLCKEEGHLAKYCRNTEPPSLVSTIITNDIDESNPKTILPTDKVVSVNPILSEDKDSTSQTSTSNFVLPRPMPTKRPLSSSTSINDSASGTVTKIENPTLTRTKQPAKKIKTKKAITPQISLQDLSIKLLPVKEAVATNIQKYPLDFDSITDFLHSSYNNPKILDNALRYTQDISALISMLSDIKDLLTERSIKSRIIRIIKKLIISNSSSVMDDCSSTDLSCMEIQES